MPSLNSIHRELRANNRTALQFVQLLGDFTALINFDSQSNEPVDILLSQLVKKTAGQMSSGENQSDDFIGQMCSYVLDPIESIAENTRTKIIKEYEMLPTHKVKELDFTAINHLSRQPGRNIYEKLLLSPKIKAPIKRFSFDTLENRLFKEFVIRLDEILHARSSITGLAVGRCDDTATVISDLMDLDIFDEISDWANEPPNNALLSDRNYSKILAAYEQLLKIDIKISNARDGDAGIYLHMLAIKMMAELITKYDFRVMEQLISFDFENLSYSAKLLGKPLLCQYRANGVLKAIQFFVNSDIFEILDLETRKVLTSIKKTDCRNKDASYFAGKNAARLAERLQFEPPIDKAQSVKANDGMLIMDLFSVTPKIYRDGYQEEVTGPTIMQICDGTQYICESSLMDTSIESFTINNIFLNGRTDIIKPLFAKIKTSGQLHLLVFPDDISDISLKPVKQAVNSIFGHSIFIPYSVAVAFHAVNHGSYKHGDYLLIAEQFGRSFTITPVRLLQDDKTPFVYERHPTITLADENINLDESLIFEMLGMEGLCENSGGKISFWDGKSFINETSQIAEKILRRIGRIFDLNKISKITNFAKETKYLLVSDSLQAAATGEFFVFSHSSALAGISLMQALANKTGVKLRSLWKDRLPELVIKDGIEVNGRYASFTLVGRDHVLDFGDKNESDIEIKNKFVLPANKKEHGFTIAQGTGLDEKLYYIRLKSSIFPLTENMTCSLKLTYNFENDEPYSLSFVPEDSQYANSKIRTVFYDTPKYKVNSPQFPKDELDRKNVLSEGSYARQWIDIFCKYFELVANYARNDFDFYEGMSDIFDNGGDFFTVQTGKEEQNFVFLAVNMENHPCIRPAKRGGFFASIDGYFFSNSFLERISRPGIYIAGVLEPKTVTDNMQLRYVVDLGKMIYSIMFPIWRSGFSLASFDISNEFKGMIYNTTKNCTLIIEKFGNSHSTLRRDALRFLSVLRSDMPEDSVPLISGTLHSSNYLERLYSAYSVGDLSRSYQTALFNEIVSEYIKNPDDIAGVLSTVICSEEGVVFSLPANKLNLLLDKANTVIRKSLYRLNSIPKGTPLYYKAVNGICRCLELVFHMLRLRDRNETFLHPSSRLSMKWLELIQQISETDLADDFDKKSFIKNTSIPDNFKGRTPTLCYLLHIYLSGKDEDTGPIQIDISEE